MDWGIHKELLLSQIPKLVTKILHVCGFSFNMLVFHFQNCSADVCQISGWNLRLALLRIAPKDWPMMSLLSCTPVYTVYVPLVDNDPNSTESKGQFVPKKDKLFL